MKIIILMKGILNFVSVGFGPLLILIVDFIKVQKSSIKENFLNLESNYMMYKLKNISKLYNHNHKYVCRRNFSVVIPDRNSDLNYMHGEHPTLISIYKDKNLGYFFISLNFTTNSCYKKIAEAGILHESKSVHMYPKCDIKELKTVEDIKNLTNYLKDVNIKQAYTEEIRNNPIINKGLQKDLKLELKNEYGCKDLIDLTENMTNKKDLNIILLDITKDLEIKKID